MDPSSARRRQRQHLYTDGVYWTNCWSSSGTLRRGRLLLGQLVGELVSVQPELVSGRSERGSFVTELPQEECLAERSAEQTRW